MKHYSYQRLEWCVNGTQQLQRLAHEELRYGKWTDCDSQVPIESTGADLGVLGLSDMKYPRLKGQIGGVDGDSEESGTSPKPVDATVNSDTSVHSSAEQDGSIRISTGNGSQVLPLGDVNPDMNSSLDTTSAHSGRVTGSA